VDDERVTWQKKQSALKAPQSIDRWVRESGGG